MSTLAICVLIVMVCGVALLVAMFPRNDNRLGMAGLGVLMAADILAMVHAALNA
ncbi:hypothetical protein GCM10023191_018310 [Actinoallomurus oryzae]|jgi:hypothetical protein|uniref:Uncharacterized protein n=1 Tax=Actinoallomurus oryzae TaxID=502180 RepID=A0ABP8PM72_9ACTN